MPAKVTTKRIVEITDSEGDTYTFILEGEGERATIRMGFEGGYEDELYSFKAVDVLDAMVAMFPENVAYQFPKDDD